MGGFDTLLLVHIMAQLDTIVSTLEELGNSMTSGQQSNQEQLNQLASDLTEAANNVQSEVSSLREEIAAGTKPEQLDFSGIKDAIRTLQQATSTIESGEPTVNPL